MTLNIIEIGGFVIGSLAALGIVAGGFGFLVSSFLDGKNKKSNDNLQKDDTLLNYLTKQNDSYAGVVLSQNEKIATLTANNTYLEKKVEELKAIVDGRDPGTKQFQEAMVKFISSNTEYQNSTLKILAEMMKRLEGLGVSHEEIKTMVQEPKSIHIEGSAKMT